MKVTVEELTTNATLLAGRAGLGRQILSAQVTAPELSSLGSGRETASSVMHLRPGQLRYLCSLPVKERVLLARALVKQKPACILLSSGSICRELLDQASRSKIPVLKTLNLPDLRRLLVGRLLPRTSLHGVLVKIFELGTLIIGESAVGKSEAALDLVLRGHKLAAETLLSGKEDGEISGAADEYGPLRSGDSGSSTSGRCSENQQRSASAGSDWSWNWKSGRRGTSTASSACASGAIGSSGSTCPI
jgi:serine kinase of HPr protein (carbohydrate metabolism regulator)